jgi:hypothetical protein
MYNTELDTCINVSICICTVRPCTKCVHGLATDLYLPLMILRKPEEFHIIIHTAFVTPHATADFNSNGDIMRQNSNYTH